MKRIVCVLAASALLSSSVALADPMTIDLDAMTPKEIKELISMAEDEYKEATDISSSDAKLLTENFKSAFESLIPKDADVSYPLFGLDKQRARTMYMLSGDCTVKFADKSKSTFSMAMIYWHEEEAKMFHQVAFYSKEKIYYCDNAILPHVAPYLSDSVLEKLGANEIVYTATSAMETPVPTETPEVTPVPTATPTPEPTPEITPVPTAATQEAYIENALRNALEDLRYTYATILYDAGVDEKTAQRWLGHTSPEMTRDLYAKLTAERKARSDQNLNDYFKRFADKLSDKQFRINNGIIDNTDK